MTQSPLKTPDAHAPQFSKMALTLLEKHQLQPTPTNYAVWYHYAAGTNKNLSQEIDALVNNAVKFRDETCRTLHDKYVAVAAGGKAVDDAAAGAQHVLAEVLKVITEFGGETKNYNQGIGEYMGTVTQKFAGTAVGDIVKDLVQATAKMKTQGEKISQKLEESKAEINSLKKNLEEVTTEAERDFLTGAYNRKSFERLFAEQSQIAKQKHTDLCLLMIDIDHFKRFNDKFGHLLGDQVLKIVARALMDTLKGRDVVARFGGEEFVAILPETPAEGAMKVAEIIRSTIATKELKRKDTGENYGTITVSIGVSHCRPNDTLPTLLKRADDALYEAKRGGRNRVVRESAHI